MSNSEQQPASSVSASSLLLNTVSSLSLRRVVADPSLIGLLGEEPLAVKGDTQGFAPHSQKISIEERRNWVYLVCIFCAVTAYFLLFVITTKVGVLCYPLSSGGSECVVEHRTLISDWGILQPERFAKFVQESGDTLVIQDVKSQHMDRKGRRASLKYMIALKRLSVDTTTILLEAPSLGTINSYMKVLQPFLSQDHLLQSSYLTVWDITLPMFTIAFMFLFILGILGLYLPVRDDVVIDFSRGSLVSSHTNVFRIRYVRRHALTEFSVARKVREKHGRKMAYGMVFSFFDRKKIPVYVWFGNSQDCQKQISAVTLKFKEWTMQDHKRIYANKVREGPPPLSMNPSSAKLDD